MIKNISDFGNEVKEFESIGQTLSSVQDWSLDKSFRGTFDGNGNGIYGFTILPNGVYCGLFTSIGKEGVVKNLNNVQEALAIARHCLDQSSGVVAAAELYNNMENIRKAVPIEDDAVKRLVLAKKYSMDAENVFRI